MRRITRVAIAAGALTVFTAPIVEAIPLGLLGYEGQPGNQGGGGHNGNDGGGSTTCSPGQQGNPKPGFKPGSC